ncbi:hypothetical protein GCM10026987_02090 [Belliella aquatica]|uniref:HTH araC/xylS-type domain-containing protein n=1 Tax=Belliella aquatica TaxID=1323734 RepID=A0ABQ1N4G0_9BACT|nr:hypothetical protein GCM10010993_34730 [Belliella aquatica]
MIGLYQIRNVNITKTKETPLKDDFNEVIEAVKMAFDINKIYIKPDINVEKLAFLIGHPTRATSYVINNYFGMNFNQLINNYRIKEAISKLENGYLKEFTIDALWSEIGFSNRTTFYKKFKEFTGLTPMEFVKKDQSVQKETPANKIEKKLFNHIVSDRRKD